MWEQVWTASLKFSLSTTCFISLFLPGSYLPPGQVGTGDKGLG